MIAIIKKAHLALEDLNSEIQALDAINKEKNAKEYKIIYTKCEAKVWKEKKTLGYGEEGYFKVRN